jgi:hypothetical protein
MMLRPQKEVLGLVSLALELRGRVMGLRMTRERAFKGKARLSTEWCFGSVLVSSLYTGSHPTLPNVLWE